MHEVLVKAGHGYKHKHAGEKLLPEVVGVRWIVEEEYLAGLVGDNGAGKVGDAHVEAAGDDHNAADQRAYKADGLKRVGPDERLDAALVGVEPDECHGENDVDGERYAERIENKRLEHNADNEEAHRRAEHLGDEEEPCACAVACKTEAVFKVAVDADKVHAVEHRYQHKRDEQCADKEAEHHLHVGVAVGGDGAGDGDECDA